MKFELKVNESKMKNSIRTTLNTLGLVSEKTIMNFNKGTRDNEEVVVKIDNLSGVIFIDDFYVGDNTYEEGNYRNDKKILNLAGGEHYEALIDANRRFSDYNKYFNGKNILDFGCGSGDFLKLSLPHCKNVAGVELQRNYALDLKNIGIPCYDTLDSIEEGSIEACFSFSVIEHLPDPINTLMELKSKLVKGATLIVEVPHANDFLLKHIHNQSFKDFTLWSQHLILHTRDSLSRLLNHVGFRDITVKGLQRYPLSNHLGWLNYGKPGGHKSHIAMIDSEELTAAYGNALARIDATDFLVAHATA